MNKLKNTFESYKESMLQESTITGEVVTTTKIWEKMLSDFTDLLQFAIFDELPNQIKACEESIALIKEEMKPITATVGWDVDGTAKNAKWDLRQKFKTFKVAEAWIEWNLKYNTKYYDLANSNHIQALEYADEMPDDILQQHIDELRGK